MTLNLTEREADVARLGLRGLGTCKIATALGVSNPRVSAIRNCLNIKCPGISHAFWLAKQVNHA